MIDPRLDLSFERVVPVSPRAVWRAWTEPEHLMPWFCPLPWTTIACEIDLRPGGRFHTVMRSPEGEEFPNVGCYLEVVPERRLVWTDALEGGWRPSRAAPHLPFRFTALLDFAPEGSGTRYRATVLHAEESARQQHEAMGFHDGWSAALTQLVEHARNKGL